MSKEPSQPDLGGRPTTYTNEIGAEICFRIAQGESLKKMCLEVDMPHFSTFMRWVIRSKDGVEEYDGLCDLYYESRQIRAHMWADEIIDISDDDGLDQSFVEHDGEVRAVLNSQNIQRSKLRVDSRKWLMSKLLPKEYGDKVIEENQTREEKEVHIHINGVKVDGE